MISPPPVLFPQAFNHQFDISSHWHISLLPELEFPPSPANSSSSSSTSTSHSTASPSPDFLHVVCNAPLVAPIPLPYHSPTFLQFDLLPDIDDDLSYPPYTARRASKRKRTDDRDGTQQDLPVHVRTKRRTEVLCPPPPQWTLPPSTRRGSRQTLRLRR